jgi:hypothetical protein
MLLLITIYFMGEGVKNYCVAQRISNRGPLCITAAHSVSDWRCQERRHVGRVFSALRAGMCVCGHFGREFMGARVFRDCCMHFPAFVSL